MEVLAPAGSKDSFKAALAGGADAIYLGGKLFGARRFAQNFTDAELKGAVKVAHEKGVKVYVTVNTLIKESELGLVHDYLDLLDSLKVDAVIVQDRGLARLIHDRYALDVHASTQMGIHSPDDARWAESMGMKRVILPRELTLKEVECIRSSTSIGMEVFVHGALCYAFSGQCLFSSVLGGRSGNRGMCAQPCRKRYSLGLRTGFLLSTADLFTVELLPELIALGVDAIKIEGRLRSPVYVYLATRTYKQAIGRAGRGEDLITPREREMLSVAFNRGFTTGYLKGDEVMQTTYPESRGLLLGKAISEGRRVRITGVVGTGDGITFYQGGEKVGGFEVRTPIIEGDWTVLPSPYRMELGEYTVYKTKDREFGTIEKEIHAISLPALPVRRRTTKLDLPTVHRSPVKGELSFYISSLPSLDAVIPYAHRVYFDEGPNLQEAAERCKAAGVEMVIDLPRVTPDVPPMPELPLMVHSPGQAFRYPHQTIYGSYFMNMFNSLCVPKLHQYTLSVELSRDDIKNLAAHYRGRLEVMVFGRVELMLTRDRSLSEGTLVDERGARFPVHRDPYSFTHIMNSADLFLMDFLPELEAMGVESFGLDLRHRPADLCQLVAKAFQRRDIKAKDRIRRRVGAITAGHYLRGVQ